MFAADFETELTTAGLSEASPALASGLAADLPFLADAGAALATALTGVLAAGLVVALVVDLETGLELALTDTEADLELDWAVGLTAALGWGDAAAMVFLMPTDRVIRVLFCMECACRHELAQQTLGLRKPLF